MVIAFTTILGLLIGSFLTVVVDRVPDGRSVVAPGSACGNCGLELGPVDLVPIFSWLALRGRCRRCKAKIGVEPLILEVANGALFAVLAIHFGLSWELGAFCALAAGLVALSWIDLRTKRLPREITITTAAIGIPLLCVAALVRHEPRRIWMMALGAAIAFAFIGAIYVLSKGAGMGWGDVILAPLLGAFLGWLNPGLVAPGLFLAFLAGAIVGVAVIARGGGRKSTVPFGPFLALGTLVAVWAGQPMIDAVLHR